MWRSQALPAETVRAAAGRFVLEFFGEERDVVWAGGPGEFRFADGAWVYRIALAGGDWEVSRTGELTPAAKAYGRARRRSRGCLDCGVCPSCVERSAAHAEQEEGAGGA